MIKLNHKIIRKITQKFTSPNLSFLASALLIILLGAPIQAKANIDTSALVGSTAGNFSVNQGAANYTIPITIPPGVAGMKPELSINYSSQAGNGLLGIGFSLGGVSAITRCAKTIATDGAKGGVNYNTSDKYCIDGQRLIAISGTAGRANSEYRTEIDNFSRVKYNGNYWSVETKSGQTFEYGNTTDSKIEAQGKSVVRLWAVNKITDATDNAITYHYNENNSKGEHTLEQINYANNANSIRFTYENRTDANAIYQAGSKITQSKLLTSITTYVGDQALRSYDLTYGQTGVRQLNQLASLQECVNNECLPATVFTYKNIASGFTDTNWLPRNIGKQWQSNLGSDWKNRPTHKNGEHSMLIDINGDGLLDRVFDRNPSNDQQGFYVFLNTGNGFKSGRQWQSNLGSDWKNRPTHKNGEHSMLIDINGDGLPDRVFDRNPSNDQQGFYVFLNTGNGFDSGRQWQSNLGSDWKNRPTHKNGEHSMLIDINGDGLPDRVFDRNPSNDQQGFYVFLNTGNGFDSGRQWQSNLGSDWKNRLTHKNGEHSMLIDINGDGLPDRVFDRNPSNDQQGLYVFLNTGNGFDSGRQWQSNLGSDWKNRLTHKNGEHSMLIDINGDGLPDRVFDRNPSNDQQGLYVFLNTGNGFDSGRQWQSNLGSDWKNRPTHKNGEHSMLIDINGDGLPDRVFDRDPSNDQQGFYVFLNTGNGFDSGRQWQFSIVIDWKNRPTHKNGEHSMMIDINGDGLLDRVFDRNPTNEQHGFFVILNKTNYSKIKSITNGLGIKTTLNYKPLTDSSVYKKDSNATYPSIDIQNAMQVVSSVITDNAIGGENTTSYTYGGAKANLKGRGLLGFRWIETKDQQSNKITRSEYLQDFPYTGQIKSNKEYIKQNGGRILLNEQINSYSSRLNNTKVSMPYLTQSIEKSYAFSNGNFMNSVTTNYDNYDDYGNIEEIVVSTVGDGETFTKTTNNTYSNDADNWHLGRLTHAEVTHSHSQEYGESITRTSSFGYYDNGLLRHQTIEPGTDKWFTTVYGYDSYGNKTVTVVLGGDISYRITSRVEYDANGQFPIQITNALGHSEYKTYDNKTGNILSLTGPNNLTTEWQYDSLGRKITQTRADGTHSSWDYNWAIGEATNSIYKISQTNSGKPEQITYFDAFNRLIKKTHQGFDGRWVNQDTNYDNLGRITSASLPYFSGDTAYYVSSEYDAIGRVVEITKPNDNFDQATETTEYQGLVTVQTNALGNQKTISKNAIGKIIRIDEPEGAWLVHRHDSIGNLVKTIVGGVQTTMAYDIRGNKISMNDPDMGTWNYEYDVLGQLTKQTDAKGQIVATVYDKLGRIIKRTEAEGTTNWTYDTASNGIGKLASVQAPTGYRKDYNYDAFGRVATVQTHADNQTFNISNQYDNNSRLSKQTLPQNFLVENVYNEQGYLSAIRSPKEQIADYDWEHLAELLENSLFSVEEALEKANYYEQKVSQYQKKAEWYKSTADFLMGHSKRHADTAKQLREDADKLISTATKLQQQAKMYKELADAYFIAMNRFIYLSAMNVPADQQRSYVATDEQKNSWSISYSSSPGMVGTSYSNGYASCKDKNWCDILVRVSKSIGEMFNRIAIQKVQQAQELIDEVQQKYQQAEMYQRRSYILSYSSIYLFAKEAQSYIQKAQQASEKAIFWRDVAEKAVKSDNRDHYQAMLADSDNVYFWRAKSMDAANRLTGNIFGNGLSTEKTYNQATGHLNTIQSGFKYDDHIRNLTYQYDKMDNVISRQNHINGLQEQFNYDNLDRLISADTLGEIGGISVDSQQSFDYDINGNITYKSDIGDYNYNSVYRSLPHTPQYISNGSNNQSYQYDANGNMIQSGDKQIAWTSFNKPKTFSKGDFRTQFVYAPDRARYLKVQTGNNTHIRTNYVGKVYEQISDTSTTTPTTKHRYFIYADGQLITIHSKTTANNSQLADETRYLHRDNLGSIDTITDGRGNIVERLSYDAFGKRRAANWRTDDDITAPVLTNRGFTGHEHIDEMGFIHMNGRVYDPSIGRFLSADPNIQSPYNTQSYNRYSYVLNNPLKYTDPSGYFFKKLFRSIKRFVKKYARVIVAAVVSYVSAGALSSWAASWAGAVGTVGNSIATGSILGFSSGAIITGSLKGAVNGAFTGAIMGGIAGHYGDKWSASRVGANAVGGGVASEATGGKFRDGFKLAGLTSAMQYVYHSTLGRTSSWQTDSKDLGEQKNYVYHEDSGTVVPRRGVFGINQEYAKGEWATNWLKQGATIPKFIDKWVPGMPSLDQFHDYNQMVFDKIGGYTYDSTLRSIGNVPAMVPATVITYGSLLEGYPTVALIVDKSSRR